MASTAIGSKARWDGLQLGRSVRAAATGVQRAGYIVSPRAQLVYCELSVVFSGSTPPRTYEIPCDNYRRGFKLTPVAIKRSFLACIVQRINSVGLRFW